MESKKDSYAIYDFQYRGDEERENNQKFWVYSTCVERVLFSDKASDIKDLLSKGHTELQNYIIDLSENVFKDVRKPDLKELRPRANRPDKFLSCKWYEPEMESGYNKTGTYGNLVSVDKVYMLSVLQENLWTLVCKIIVE